MAISLLCAAAFASAMAVKRMLGVTDEDAGYAKGLWADNWQPGSRTIPAFDPKQYPRWWPMPRLHLDVIAPGSGIIARSRRWRAVVKLNWIIFLLLPGINVVMQLWMQHGNTSAAMRNSSMALAGPYLFFPASMVAGNWTRVWPCLELDFLRGPARRDFIREIGASIAIQTSQAWAIIAAVFTIGAVMQHFPAILLFCVLLGSLATQALAFGAAVWVMRYRSAGLVWLLGIPLFLPITMIAFLQDSKWTVWLFFTCLAACGFALTGIWLTKRAYRLWLETELG
jgi:hypothetical protein